MCVCVCVQVSWQSPWRGEKMSMALAGGKSQRLGLCPLHGGREDLLESIVKTGM